MRSFILLFLGLFLLVSVADAQKLPLAAGDKLFILADGSRADAETEKNAVEELNKTLSKLKSMRSSTETDRRFLEKAMQKLRNRHLRFYRPAAFLTETLQTGDYGCLSGTMLTAIVLQNFGYEYTVFETNFHVYLTVETTDGKVLIEVTDPLNGFVSDSAEIEARIARYDREFTTGGNLALQKIHRQSDFAGLVDLQFYNLAVSAYKRGEYKQAEDLLQTNQNRRNAARFRDLMTLVGRKIILEKQAAFAGN